jgi:integrase
VYHLDTFAVPGLDGLIFPNEHGKPFLRGNLYTAVPWSKIRVDLRHTGNTLAAQSGARLRDLMVRIGHDSPAAAMIYQHSTRAADEAIAAALDIQLSARQRADESGSQTVSGGRAGPNRGKSDAVGSPN